MYQEPDLPHGSNICFCTACGLLFSGVAAFDKHRINFKCMSVAQMIKRGMALNARGRWVTKSFEQSQDVMPWTERSAK